MTRGRRESSWMVMRRCLALIRRVQQGPATTDDLLEVIQRFEEGGSPGPQVAETSNVLRLRLEKDLARIRERLLVDVYFDDQQGGYVIQDTWLPLLDLSDQDLETIAWLEETFDYRSPKHDQVCALLRNLRLYLDPDRVAIIEQARTALRLDLRQRDDDRVHPNVWRGLTKAFIQRHQVELLYLSPGHADGKARRHLVEPYSPYYFDTARGHYYLRAYCRRVDGPDGTRYPEKYITYRLGRIREAKVLPQKLQRSPPASPRYEVTYQLAPGVARFGVTTHPEIGVRKVDRRQDGGAVVHGETESVFWAVQVLLHYGAQCEVLGGPEMRREMERVVEEMGKVYSIATD